MGSLVLTLSAFPGQPGLCEAMRVVEQATERSPATGAGVWVPLVTLWIMWGTTYLGASIIGDTMPPVTANGARVVCAALILALILAVVRGPRSLRVTRDELRSLLILGTMLLGVSITVTSLAVRVLPSGIAALIASVSSLFVVLLRARSGDRPARRTWLGVAIGLTGLTLMLVPGGTAVRSGTDSDALLWSLAMLGSMLCWSIFSFRAPRYRLPSNPLVVTMYEMAVAGMFIVLVGLLIGEQWDLDSVSSRSMIGWGWLVIVSVIGYLAFVTLLGRAPLSLVMTYGYVNPIIAVLLGWLINGEHLTTDVLIGLTIVLGGVVLVVSGERGGSSGEPAH